MFSLNKSQWHARLFFWALSISEECFGVHTDAAYSGRTNLCHYIRTILVNMPLALLLNAGLVAWFFFVITFFPAQHVGWINYSYAVGGLVGLTIAALCLFYFIGWCWDKFKRWREKHSVDSGEPPKPRKKINISFANSFWAMLWEYIVSQKKKICPTIEIK